MVIARNLTYGIAGPVTKVAPMTPDDSNANFGRKKAPMTESEMLAARLQMIRKLCTKYGVLLIYDEVQCGAGRTATSSFLRISMQQGVPSSLVPSVTSSFTS